MINRHSINGAFITSAIAIAIAAIVVLSGLPSLVGAMFMSDDARSDPKDVIAGMMDQHDETLETYRARFAGRSIFYTPPAPPPPPRPPAPVIEPVVEPEDEPEPEYVPPPPPPPPAEYGGPPPFVAMSKEAWFRPHGSTERTIRLRIGEEKEGVKLLATDPPRSVLVEYGGGEYKVEVFPWDLAALDMGEVDRSVMEGMLRRRSDEIDASGDAAPQPPSDIARAGASTGDDVEEEVDPEVVAQAEESGEDPGADAEEPGAQGEPDNAAEPTAEPIEEEPEPAPEPEEEPSSTDEPSGDDPEEDEPAPEPDDEPQPEPVPEPASPEPAPKSAHAAGEARK